MNERTLVIPVEGEPPLEIRVRGETGFGPDRVLLDEDDDLTRDAPWHDAGFVVAPLSTPDEHARLVAVATGCIADGLRDSGIDLPGDFQLERYHTLVGDAQHLAVMKRTGAGYAQSILGTLAGRLVARVSELCGRPVVAHSAEIDRVHFRVVRPGAARDNNPPHRDVWLDRLRHAVNVYVPIVGSTARSALPLVPGSHRWKESEIERTLAGAEVDGAVFTVPSVVAATRELKLVRPDPPRGAFMVFSPYLVHGGGRNRNADVTRVSLEMRFFAPR